MAETVKQIRETELEVAIPELVNVVVKDITHQDFDRVTELASNYRSFVTGDGLDKMMRRFTMRETQAAFEQRQNITQHIIPAVVGNITSVERKVPRSNGKTRVLAYKEDTGHKRAKELEAILDKYWGAFSLDDWMATRWIELNDIDPNTFVVIEWDKFNAQKEKAQPRPYESKSVNAVMFEFINNILQFLIDLNSGLYTMYLKYQTIQAVLIPEDTELFKLVSSQATEVGEIITIDDVMYFKKSDKVYYMIVILKPHNLGYVPAFRAGYKRDELTDGRTFISPYHDCVPYLMKTIKANSELDLTMALHAFPQKLITAPKCTGPKCNGGLVYEGSNSSVCKVCDGTGFLPVHSSAQDIIWLPIPRGKEEQLSLDNMVRYVTPEVALLEFQRDYIEYLTAECMQAVFNSDIFTKEEVAVTATEKRINLDNVYDTLWPLSIWFGRSWKFQVETTADVTGLAKNLIASLTFSKDFKFKSKDDYIRDRAAAKEAGTPDAILRNIDDEIMKIDTSENPAEFIIYKTIQSFDPFSGKSDEEIATAMASNTVPFDVKVFYANLGWIFDAVAMENEDFFMKPRKQQAKILEEKVDSIVVELEKNQTQTADFTE